MDIKIDKKQVISLYHSGMNMRQVGEALGVSNLVICQFMIKHNINARPSGSKPCGGKRAKLDWDQVVNMRNMCEHGISKVKIAEILGVTASCISKFMKKHNIQTRKTGLGRSKKIGIKNE